MGNWAFLGANAEVVEEPCLSDFTGRKTGWLRKIKHDRAKGKLLSDRNWRFFTVDFDDQAISYSNSESSKTTSALISFSDIVDVKLLVRKSKRGLTDHLLGNQDEVSMGLRLITSDREIRLLCKNMNDAKQWFSIFAAARQIAQAPMAKSLSKAFSAFSIASSSDESAPQLSDCDSDIDCAPQLPYASAELVAAKQTALKDMAAEDRTAYDIALLKRQQMFPKSGKAQAGDAPPLKATQPLKRPGAWKRLCNRRPRARGG